MSQITKRMSNKWFTGAASLMILVAAIALWIPGLAAQFGRDQSVGRTLRLTLQPWGFEPDEVTIGPGPIAVEVQNKVGFEELNLRLEVEQGTGKPRLGLLQELFKREEPKWRNVFTLTPGVYVVSVGTNEKWISTIMVKAGAQ